MFTRHQGVAPPLNLSQRFAALEAERAARPKDTYLSHPVGVAFTAITLLIMAYSWMFPVFPILLYYGMWFGLVLWKGPRILLPTRDMLVAMLIPLLSLASTLWSNYPAKSIYLGTAFVLMMGCIVIMARVIHFRSLILGLMLGVAVTLLLSLANGRSVVDPMDGSYALMGLFTSKNQIGFCAELGIVACLVLLFCPGNALRKLATAIVPLGICLWSLYLSRSGTALVSLAATLLLVGSILLVMRLSGQLRMLAAAVGLFLFVGLIGTGIAMDWQDLLLKGLGKDATLTGRTYLWTEGMKIGWERPLLGHGYGAFWVPGQPQAERFWAEFHIPRYGFHFHNTYVEAFVELGALGVMLITLLIVANCLAVVRTIARHGVTPEAALLLSFSLMFLVRSFAEVDFFTGPFGMGSLLFYLILPRLATLRRENDQAPHQRST